MSISRQRPDGRLIPSDRKSVLHWRRVWLTSVRQPVAERRLALFDPIDVHVGARVKLRRKLLGMSQERLGATLDVTFQQIQKYERGANRIGASNLYKISCALGVSPAFFFEGIDPDILPVSSPKPPMAEADPTAIGDQKIRQAVEDLIKTLVERTG